MMSFAEDVGGFENAYIKTPPSDRELRERCTEKQTAGERPVLHCCRTQADVAATTVDLAGREGFDEDVLGPHVPLPALSGVETVLLPYTHFSVQMRLDKRLASVTGLGIDGRKLMDLDRSGIKWRLDPRLREDQQTCERVYDRNDIDRGHLVRRASAVWGDTRAESATRVGAAWRELGALEDLDLDFDLES